MVLLMNAMSSMVIPVYSGETSTKVDSLVTCVASRGLQ